MARRLILIALCLACSGCGSRNDDANLAKDFKVDDASRITAAEATRRSQVFNELTLGSGPGLDNASTARVTKVLGTPQAVTHDSDGDLE